MAATELIMPKMGESIMEATILGWQKKEGDHVDLDETVLEIATDKVDTEVPSPVEGIITKILFKEGDVVAVGKAVAVIETENEIAQPVSETPATPQTVEKKETLITDSKDKLEPKPVIKLNKPESGRFYSPLVLNIARKENIPMSMLDQIPGSGKNGRLTKKDLLAYLQSGQKVQSPVEEKTTTSEQHIVTPPEAPIAPVNHGPDVEIEEMDRMRKLIAEHMVRSKHTSAHVTSFVEVDVNNIVTWRNKIKNEFLQREGQKITYTPIFIEAVVAALKMFPYVNASVDGNSIIKHKKFHIGMATALPGGNLIVPVIKNADQLNLVGLAKAVNDLANRARSGKLKPGETDGGTFTITNVGTFGNVMGTPIINQPQVAILAVGAIRKKPVVIESAQGDMIAIRHMMMLSLSYDHRLVDGAMGGAFVRRVADILEQFDPNQNY